MNRLCFSFLLTLMYSCGNGKTEHVTVAQDTVPKIQETKPIITKKMTDKAFIEKFTELGYFDYTEKDKLKIVQDSVDSCHVDPVFLHVDPPFGWAIIVRA